MAACLAALKFDVPDVVSRLLDGRPPPEVAHLSPSLAAVGLAQPRTLRAAAPKADAKFAALQRARLRKMEKDALDDDHVRSVLYDDDYDDRYDGPDDPVVAATSLGDQDAVRRANAVARADEAEAAFWASQRNTNRPAAAAGGDDDKDDDKDDDDDDDATVDAPAPPTRAAAVDPAKVAIQRKRQTKNKAAVANHHRKDRALKKNRF